MTYIQKEIIKMLIKHPNISTIELEIFLNINHEVIRLHLQELIKDKIVEVEKRRPFTYCVNASFIENHPVFKLNNGEEECLKKIIERFEIDTDSLANLLKIPKFLVQEYITTLSQYHFIKKEIKEEKHFFSVDKEFIQNNPAFLSEIEQKLLSILIGNSMLDIYELAEITKTRISDLNTPMECLVSYDFIDSKTINGNKKWSVKENQQLLSLFKNCNQKTYQSKISKPDSEVDDDYNDNHKLTLEEKKILLKIAQEENLTHKELAIALNKSTTSLSNKLKILREHHFVSIIKVGRNTYYRVNNKFMDNSQIANETFQEQENLEVKNNDLTKDSNYDHNYSLTKIDRETLYHIIQNPEESCIEIAVALNLNTTTLGKILKVLKKHRFMEEKRVGIKTYYIVNEKFIEDNPNIEMLHEDISDFSEQKKEQRETYDYNHDYELTKTEKETLYYIIKNPGFTHKELAASLNLGTPAFSNRIKALKEHHLIEIVKIGRNCYYCINPLFLNDYPNFLNDFEKDREKREDYNHDYKLKKEEKEVLYHIIQNPNITLENLLKETSTQYRTIKKLKRYKLIFQKKKEKKICFKANANFIGENPDFNPNSQPEENGLEKRKAEQIEKLEKQNYNHDYELTETEKETLYCIIKNPGFTHKELATSLNIGITAFSNRTKALKENHFIDVIKIGTCCYYYINRFFLDDYLNFLNDFEKKKEKDADYNHDCRLNTRQKKVLYHIIHNPNITLQELLEKTSARYGTVKKLREYRLVFQEKKEKKICYQANANFVRENPDFDPNSPMEERDLEKNSSPKMDKKQEQVYIHGYKLTKKEKETLHHIVQNPNLTYKELAISLHLKPNALNNRLKHLKEHHLIETIRIGKNCYYFANDKFLEAEKEKTDSQNNNINKDLLLLLIKNLLELSPNVDAKILLNNLHFFQNYFSLQELIELLFLLNICNDIPKEIKEEDKDRKIKLLLKYQKLCLYLSGQYNSQEASIPSSPKVKGFGNNDNKNNQVSS